MSQQQSLSSDESSIDESVPSDMSSVPDPNNASMLSHVTDQNDASLTSAIASLHVLEHELSILDMSAIEDSILLGQDALPLEFSDIEEESDEQGSLSTVKSRSACSFDGGNDEETIQLLQNKLELCDDLAELEQAILAERVSEGTENVRMLGLQLLLRKSLQIICPEKQNTEQFQFLQSTVAEIAPVNYQNDIQLKCAVGEEVAGLVGKERKFKTSVHLLSILCGHMRKKDIERLIGRSISNNQYRAAKQHRENFGPGVPYEKEFIRNHRRRIEEKTVQEFVEWLNAVGLLQNLAFGEKVVRVSNGFHVAIESVKRTQTIQNITRYYYRQFMGKRDESNDNGDEDSDEDGDEDGDVDGDIGSNLEIDNDYSDDEYEQSIEGETKERCSEICRKSRLRCTSDKDHSGRHKFTPPDLLSPSTLTKLLLTLTSGEIKSRAGLDNTDVIKGHDNFEQMRSLAETLSNLIGPHKYENAKELEDRINNVEEFHKVDFERHLEGGTCKCMCLQCGFYCSKTDPIVCKMDGKHDHPCKKCQESFQVLIDLQELHFEAELVARERYRDTPTLEDDIDVWKKDLLLCTSHLMDYRAHIAHKHSEAIFDADYYSSLDEAEVVVICDWKMKILASRYREAQAEWFSKRGCSLLGFEIHFKSKDGATTNVLYHFFLSDDTLQDAESVLCAKHFLYTKVLPKYGIKKIRFRSDGAGCFSAKEAKAYMAVWDDIATLYGGAYETSYKVSVAGCGKTALDGMFGVLTMHLARLVNHGHSFESAEDLYHLLSSFPLMHSFFHLFRPKRKVIPMPVPRDMLSAFHLVQYDRTTKVASARFHSQHGTDVLFDVHGKEGFKKCAKQPRTRPKTVPRDNESLCVLNEDVEVIDASDHILLTTFDLGSLENVSPSLHSMLSYQERIITTARDKMLQHNLKIAQKQAQYYASCENNGVYCCTEVDQESACPCMCTFSTKGGRDRHKKKAEHKFPKSSLESWAHDLHLSGKFAFSLATGSRTNRSNFINQSRTLVIEKCVSEPLLHDDVDSSWFEVGCYRKRRKEPFRASKSLKADLEALFLAGFQTDGPKRGKNKYSPEQAVAFLKNLTLGNGRRKYGYDKGNINGPPPSKLYIQAWFGRRKTLMAKEEREKVNKYEEANRRKDNAHSTEERDNANINDDDNHTNNHEQIDDIELDLGQEAILEQYNSDNIDVLKRRIQQRTLASNFNAKMFYARLLEVDDELNQRSKSSYAVCNSENKLKELCKQKMLPFDTKRQSLIKFLELDDRARHFRSCLPELTKVILQHEIVEADEILKEFSS